MHGRSLCQLLVERARQLRLAEMGGREAAANPILALETASGLGAPKPSVTLFLSVLVCSVSPLLFGFSLGFTSPTLNVLDGDTSATGGVPPPGDLVQFTKDSVKWYVSLLNIGAMAGAFSGAFLSDRFGRRTTLALTGIPHLLGWVGTFLGSGEAPLIALRLFIGWVVGVGSVVTPCYIGEIATKELRGALGAANQLAIVSGICFANALGTFVFVERSQGQDFGQWRHMALLAGLLACVLFPLVLAPESPRWLAERGDHELAAANLRRLRRGAVEAELEELRATGAPAPGDTPATGGGGLKSCKKSLVIGVGLLVFQQFTGCNAVLMYTGTICEQAGMKPANAMAVVALGILVVLTGVSCVLVERLGRRTLLLGGSVAMGIADFALAYYFLSASAPPWLALAALALYIAGFSVGLGPIPWLILPEIFPTEVVAKASSIASAMVWVSSFLVTLFFVPLQDLVSKAGTFFIFGIACALSFVFTYALVPETRGKTIAEVMELLGAGGDAQARDCVR